MTDIQLWGRSDESVVEMESDGSAQSRSVRFVRFLCRSRPKFWITIGCLGGIVIPIGCFFVAANSGSPLTISQWQSGQPNQYANLMLQTPSVVPFYPFLLFCMICCGSVLFGGQRWINQIWVRFGIYTGVPVSIQFHLLVFAPKDWHPMYFASSVLSLLMGAAIVLIALVAVLSIGALLGKIRRKIGWGRSIAILVSLYVLRCLAWVLTNGPKGLVAALVPVELTGLLFLVMVFSTTLAAVTYGLLSLHVWRTAEDRRLRFGILQMLGGITWSASYLASWRLSVDMVIAEYAKLPVNQPSQCYVCTAASRGHQGFVGSFEVDSGNGRCITINRQLQLLKAAELAVMVTFPAAHRRFRWFYDRMGPPIAGCLRSPWIADAAFVSLKPIEWSAKCLLRLARITDAQIQSIYRDDYGGSEP